MKTNFSTAIFVLPLLMFFMLDGYIIFGQFHSVKKNNQSKPKNSTVCPPVFFEIIGGLTPIEPHHVYDSASIPHDISSDGKRVVGESRADEKYEHFDGISDYSHLAEAFGWTRRCGNSPLFFNIRHAVTPTPPKKGIIPFGYLPSANLSHTESYAFGISPDGRVSVGYGTYDYPSPSSATYKVKAVVFIQSGVYALAQMDTNTVAMDISNFSRRHHSQSSMVTRNPNFLRGRIIVGWTNHYNKEPSLKPSRAIYWDRPNHVQFLPVPVKILANDSTVISSEATCVSDDGSIIGGNLYYNFLYDNYHLASVPCVWKRKQTNQGFIYEITELSDLANGDLNAKINHISGNGNCLVGFGNEINGNDGCPLGAYAFKACYWTYSSTSSSWSIAQPLDILSGNIASVATGVNFDGTVIVGSSLNTTGPCDDLVFNNKACIWKKQAAGFNVEALNTILSSVKPPNWNLYTAIRVSANGKIITGYNYDFETGKEIGWVVGIP